MKFAWCLRSCALALKRNYEHLILFDTDQTSANLKFKGREIKHEGLMQSIDEIKVRR